MMLLCFFYSCNSNKVDFAIVVHGGAGTILKKNMSDEMELAYKLKLEEAINVGYNICLLYTSPSPRDRQKSRMPSSA